MGTPENRGAPIRVHFGAGLHATAGQRVDDAWSSGSSDGLSWDGRSEPDGYWPMVALLRQKQSRMILTVSSSCRRILLSRLSGNLLPR